MPPVLDVHILFIQCKNDELERNGQQVGQCMQPAYHKNCCCPSNAVRAAASAACSACADSGAMRNEDASYCTDAVEEALGLKD